MSKRIQIAVENKIAKKTCDTIYVCGNSDYVVDFTFDSEWDDYPVKTMRIITGNMRVYECVFEGVSCCVPTIFNTLSFRVGVYAGDLHSTTPAIVPAHKSILCSGDLPDDPPQSVYAQIMDVLNAALVRIEALEHGGIVKPDDETSAVLGVAILDKMVLA